MKIEGVDLHTRQQTIAMLDNHTGELVEKTLQHEGEEVRRFYSALSPSSGSFYFAQTRHSQVAATQQEWVVGDVEGVYDSRQFPLTLGIRNNLSCVVFRKEKDHEFPRSPRLETYQLN